MGLIAGTLSGIVGFGSSIMLMPVLVISYGPLQAVPIMAVAAIMANLSRILVWWRQVDWRAVAAYSITGAPAAAAGARTLLILPPHLVEAALGAFFLLMIPVRRWLAAQDVSLAVASRSDRPHCWLSHGYRGHHRADHRADFPRLRARQGSVPGHRSGRVTGGVSEQSDGFRTYGALPTAAIVKGFAIGSSLMAGSFVAKRFVLKLEPSQFRLLMDALMFVSGATMLWSASR